MSTRHIPASMPRLLRLLQPGPRHEVELMRGLGFSPLGWHPTRFRIHNTLTLMAELGLVREGQPPLTWSRVEKLQTCPTCQGAGMVGRAR